MAIIPIFIHVHDKSDKEILEEIKRDARWEKMMREEEERERRRKEEEKRKKREEKQTKEKEFNHWWFNQTWENEWDTQILPEGWSIFGQQRFCILTEKSKNDFTEQDV